MAARAGWSGGAAPLWNPMRPDSSCILSGKQLLLGETAPRHPCIEGWRLGVSGPVNSTLSRSPGCTAAHLKFLNKFSLSEGLGVPVVFRVSRGLN